MRHMDFLSFVVLLGGDKTLCVPNQLAKKLARGTQRRYSLYERRWNVEHLNVSSVFAPPGYDHRNAMVQEQWGLKKQVAALMGGYKVSNCASRLVAFGIKLWNVVCKLYAKLLCSSR